MSDPAILTVENVGHDYGAEPVLQGVSFALEPGELLAVLGASGCGKSTLLRAIAGFVCARQGRIVVGDQVVSEYGQERIRAENRAVGLVFQDYALFPHMTVGENIGFGIHMEADAATRVKDLLALVDLDGFESRYPTSLSGGQKQRVALARALAPRPRLLLLDEPFANLDGPIRMDVGHSIRRILRTAGAAGILVTHDRSEALGLADRVAVLGRPNQTSQGPAELLQIDVPSQLFHHPRSRRVAQLTGQAIFVEGRASGESAHTLFGTVSLHEPAEGTVDLMVRGHQLRFSEAVDGEVHVLDCQFNGPGYRILVDTAVGRLWISHPVLCSLGVQGTIGLRGPCAVLPRHRSHAESPLDSNDALTGPLTS